MFRNAGRRAATQAEREAARINTAPFTGRLKQIQDDLTRFLDEHHRNVPAHWRYADGSHVGSRFCLAVSGGVDSMALATLCSRISKVTEHEFVGFIVDHGLRPESGEEAKRVEAQLMRLGLRSLVFGLDWSQHGDPRMMNNFETVARELRYQTLGRWCVFPHGEGIRNILVAHHSDDQAETILSRVLTQRLGSGLQGIQREANIPDCSGIYGADRSGEPRLDLVDPKNKRVLGMESGGVKILRPLLDVRKTDLIGICKEANVPWYEDKTNADVGLTLRNTVRHLLKKDVLPEALRRPRLLALAEKAYELNSALEQQAKDLFNEIPIDMYWRSGSVEVTVDSKHIWKNEDLRVKAMVVSKFLQLVRGAPQPALQNLDRAVDFIFPDDGNYDLPRAGITVSDVCIRRIPGVVAELSDGGSSEGSNEDLSATNTRRSSNSRNNVRFEFHRQSPTVPQIQELDLGHPQALDWKQNALFGRWHLWDDQYWIRIGSKDRSWELPAKEEPLFAWHQEQGRRPDIKILVRFLSQHSLAELRRSILRGSKAEAQLSETLKSVSGHARPMLPAIVLNKGEQEEILALPSLGWKHPGSIKEGTLIPRHDAQLWTFDIRYHNIDFEQTDKHRIMARRGQPARVLPRPQAKAPEQTEIPEQRKSPEQTKVSEQAAVCLSDEQRRIDDLLSSVVGPRSRATLRSDRSILRRVCQSADFRGAPQMYQARD